MKPKVVRYLIKLLHDAKNIRNLAGNNVSILRMIKEAIRFIRVAIHDYRLSYEKNKNAMRLGAAYKETHIALAKNKPRFFHGLGKWIAFRTA